MAPGPVNKLEVTDHAKTYANITWTKSLVFCEPKNPAETNFEIFDRFIVTSGQAWASLMLKDRERCAGARARKKLKISFCQLFGPPGYAIFINDKLLEFKSKALQFLTPIK